MGKVKANWSLYKPGGNSMKKMTLLEASELIRKKRGAGVAKKTKFSINVEFEGGVDTTPGILMMFDAVLTAMQIPTGYGWPAKNFKIKQWVKTELEENDFQSWHLEDIKEDEKDNEND